MKNIKSMKNVLDVFRAARECIKSFDKKKEKKNKQAKLNEFRNKLRRDRQLIN